LEEDIHARIETRLQRKNKLADSSECGRPVRVINGLGSAGILAGGSHIPTETGRQDAGAPGFTAQKSGG
jgi:hypothetical protein